jgi:hypothetical protein
MGNSDSYRRDVPERSDTPQSADLFLTVTMPELAHACMHGPFTQVVYRRRWRIGREWEGLIGCIFLDALDTVLTYIPGAMPLCLSIPGAFRAPAGLPQPSDLCVTNIVEG